MQPPLLPPKPPPTSPGADPALDDLAHACFDGDLAACDGLLIVSETGSQYEIYAATCGGRTDYPLGSCTTLFGPVFSENTMKRSEDAVGTPSGLLVDGRMASHTGFDRFVLEFAEGGFPAYEVGYLDEQTLLIPDDPIPLEGTALLSVLVSPVHVSASGSPKAYEGPGRLRTDTVNVIEAGLIGPHGEGVEWILSLQKRTGFEVFTLGDPPRLVVDVSQQ